jgi:hypothetical protein
VPQHDYVLDNQSGFNFRADLNDALLAIVAQNSGTTEPTTKYAYQFWADTTTGLLKIRNAANSAWVIIGTLASDYLGLGAPYSGSSAPTNPYAWQWWVDTSGSPKVLKIRNAANSAWTTVGPAESANLGHLALTGGTMSAAIGFSNTDYTTVPVGTTLQRPGSPAAGYLRGNSDLAALEYFNGTNWVQGGTGGGISVKWYEDIDAPVFALSSGIPAWQFSNGQGQALYAAIKVPSSYQSGQQINLKFTFYSSDTSGNVYFKTQTTLIRSGTDQITSTTNQRTSTQGAVTVSGGTQNKPQVVTCDLTDTTGKINSVAVSANDMLLIQFFRDSGDTATGIAYLFPELSEVK